MFLLVVSIIILFPAIVEGQDPDPKNKITVGENKALVPTGWYDLATGCVASAAIGAAASVDAHTCNNTVPAAYGDAVIISDYELEYRPGDESFSTWPMRIIITYSYDLTISGDWNAGGEASASLYAWLPEPAPTNLWSLEEEISNLDTPFRGSVTVENEIKIIRLTVGELLPHGRIEWGVAAAASGPASSTARMTVHSIQFEFDEYDPPVAAFTCTKQIAFTNEKITCDASGSYDPDGGLLTFDWDLGDSFKSDELRPEKFFKNPGEYTITLMVTDNEDSHDDADPLTITVIEPCKISFLEGEVSIQRDGETIPAESGMVLKFGDTVTTGSNGKIQTVCDNGSEEVRVGENSQWRLERLGQKLLKWINRGKAWFKYRLRRHRAIRTPVCACSVRGTEFEIQVNESSTTLTVLEGLVDFSNLTETQTVSVGPHEISLISAGGNPSTPLPVDPSTIDHWWECVNDTDSDKMPNCWEELYGLNPEINDATGDLDEDGITNLQEYLSGSRPDVPSSGIPIGDLELAHAIIVLQILADMNPAVSISQGSDVDADGKIGLAEAVYVLQTLSEVRTAPSPGTECPEGSFLTLSPVSFEAVHSVVPLGNLNPPGHVFPTGHMYMYLKTLPGENAPEVTTLYSPGDLFIKGVRVAEHVNAGIRDYSILLQPCESVTLEFGHRSLGRALHRCRC